MSRWESASESLVGTSSPASLSSRMRSRRWELLHDRFPELEEMKVIDLGGTAQSWSLAPRHPGHLTLVNPREAEGEVPEWAEHVVGDACELPGHLLSESWDLVYSNSVIEHVGGHHRCLRFAESAHALSSAHWVQTPNRYFPIEPHWVFPGFQFLPARVRRAIAMRWPLHPGRRDDPAVVLDEILEIQLLSRVELASYFPGSEIIVERVLGAPKSLIAVRG